MGSITGQRKAQAIIFRATMQDYRDERLIADYGSCGPRSLPMDDLPAVTRLLNVILRMRCQSCGKRVASAALANDLSNWRGRVVRIWGPGSYACQYPSKIILFNLNWMRPTDI